MAFCLTNAPAALQKLKERCIVELQFKMWNEPPQDKTNKMACAPSEDSDQPGHSPSLIRVFAVRMEKAYVFSYPSLGAQSFCWVCHEAAQIYLDDIIIFSKTFDEQIKRLENVFKQRGEHGLKLKVSKCACLKN